MKGRIGVRYIVAPRHGIILQGPRLKALPHRPRHEMNILLALLLNIVYGFIFFLAFGVFILTVVYFGLAIWENFGKRLFRTK
jgi:hypothetical protein